MMRPLLKGFILLYQKLISPALPKRCRFAPSCSDYAIEALEVHGAWRGSLLTLKRLAKCHPFGASGWDPVPKCATKRQHKVK
ncbi:MAG: membrane protein insertion efficiency factor YidD [Holosporales bacterium]